MTKMKKDDDVVAIVISKELADELESIRRAMNMWTVTTFRISMESVIKKIIQYYYLSIGFPVSQWSKAVKGDIGELMQMKKEVKEELNEFAKKR